MTQTRLQEILGWLDAYRNGWIAYDSNHVAELQKECRQLEQQIN